LSQASKLAALLAIDFDRQMSKRKQGDEDDWMAQCLSYAEEEAVVDGSDAKSEHKKVQHAEKGTKKSKKGDQPAVKLSRADKAKLKLDKDAKIKNAAAAPSSAKKAKPPKPAKKAKKAAATAPAAEEEPSGPPPSWMGSTMDAEEATEELLTDNQIVNW